MSPQPEQVIVAGWIDWAPEHRDEVLKYFQEVTAASLAEPGCLAYVMTGDVRNPCRVHVFERWTGAAALQAHLDTPHIRSFRERTAHLTRVARQLGRYRVTAAEPMTSQRKDAS